MKSAILAAARTVLIRHGLPDWTVERIAAEAGCAKGLVIYHYRSRDQLLVELASALHGDRHGRRTGALARGGTAGLDALWTALREEVAGGEFAAWLGLAALPAGPARDAVRPTPRELLRLEAAAGSALGVDTAGSGALIAAALDGVQLALHAGHPEPGVREAYHRFWLGLIS